MFLQQILKKLFIVTLIINILKKKELIGQTGGGDIKKVQELLKNIL